MEEKLVESVKKLNESEESLRKIREASSILINTHNDLKKDFEKVIKSENELKLNSEETIKKLHKSEATLTNYKITSRKLINVHESLKSDFEKANKKLEKAEDDLKMENEKRKQAETNLAKMMTETSHKFSVNDQFFNNIKILLNIYKVL